MKNRTITTLLATGILAAALPAHAVVDFESLPSSPVPGFTLQDDQFVAFNNVWTDPDSGIQLQFGIDVNGYDPLDGSSEIDVTGGPGSNVFIEQVGTDGTDGFLNDSIGSPGVYDTDASGNGGLGNYFLRNESLQAGGGESLQGDSLFVIEYIGGPDAFIASGEIWDLDGNGSQGTEEWLIQAWCQNGSFLADLTIGPENTTSGPPNDLDGLPSTFVIDVTGNTNGPNGEALPIHHITFDFIGTKTAGIGFALDNFNASVPEPSTYAAIFGALALGLAVYRRRFSK